MKGLMQIFEKTFDDKKITTSERKAVLRILGAKSLTKHKVDLLRSKLFKFALNAVSGTKNAQIITWLEEAVKTINVAVMVKTVRNEVYFSPGTDCLKAILSELGSATRTIDICVFTISDNRIANQIKYCYQKGVKIRILTDNDKTYDTGSDIDELAKNRIPVRIDRTSNHMHHKFAIIDSKSVITGSYNWTRSAERYNHENVLITDEAGVVTKYQKEFNKLWKKMKIHT